MYKRALTAALFAGLALAGMILLPACGILGDEATLTPIYVTATPRIVVVTNTPTPEATRVLAPTLERGGTGVAFERTPSPGTTAATRVITQTPTFTPTPTDTPVTPGANPFVPAGGVGGVSGGGPVNCATPPAGGFATIFNGDASLPTQISCPLEGAVPVTVAYQPFERGLMIWVAQVGSSGQPGIYVFFNNNTYQRFNDTWREGVDPERAGLGAPPGLQEPIRGFGKIWRETGGIRDRLGWATAGEIGDTGGTIQVFERGEMIYVPQTGQTYVAVAGTPGTWTSVAVAFR